MSENNQKVELLSPREIRDKAITIGATKAALPFGKILILSIMAGMYIAFGAVFASIVAAGMAGEWPYGFAKLLQGLVFGLGLILVVVGGAELFTGNVLLVMAWVDKKIRLVSLLRNWLFVYLGNFIGSLFIVVLIITSKEYTFGNGLIGSIMLSTANAKVQYSFLQAVSLGILCNIMVCLAVWLAYSGRTTTDKILAIIGPIAFFIAAGFEHSVANMYIIPVGLLIKTFDPGFITSLSIDLSNLTLGAFFLKNLIPVTIGNILGGGIFVGLLYFFAYRNKPKAVSL